MTLDYMQPQTAINVPMKMEVEDDYELIMDEDRFDEDVDLENSDSSSSLVAGSPHGSSSGSNSSHSPSLQVESPSSRNSSGSSPSQGSNHPEKRHVCMICGKGFSYFSILESHKRSHTGEKPYNCHFCDKKFAQKATLQVHERTHTGERPYKCRYCEKTFAQYGTKTVHEKSAHLGIRNYKCPKCDKSLSSPSALYTHKKTHGDKTFRCEFCPKTFALKNYLKLHVKQVHEQNERKHVCKFCNKGFAYAGSLQVHVRTHTGERPYTCQYCPKAFASQGNLQSHERTHTGERPYSCQYCQRTFIQKSQLTAHESTHLAHKHTIVNPDSTTDTIPTSTSDLVGNYECTFCHKRYPYSSSLYIHMRKHTGESPAFPCEGCGTPYIQRIDLTIHQDKCDAFKNRVKLEAMRIENADSVTQFPHNCEGCGKTCVQRISLQIHLDQCDAYKNLLRMQIAVQQSHNSDSESDADVKIFPLPNPPLTLPTSQSQIPPPVNIYAQQNPPTSLGSLLGNTPLTPPSLHFGLPAQSVFSSLNAHTPFTPVEIPCSEFGPLTAAKAPAALQPGEAVSAFHTPARKAAIPDSPALLANTQLGPLSSSILTTSLLLHQLNHTDLNYFLQQNLLSSLTAAINLPPTTSQQQVPQFLLPPANTVPTVQPMV